MVITFNRSDLLADLKLLSSTIAPNLGVTFQVEKNLVYVVDVATNTYMHFEREFKYENDPVDFTVSLNLLIEICSSLKDEKIKLEIKSNENRVIITHKHGEYKLRMLLTATPDNLHVLEENTLLYKTTKEDFSNLLSRIQYAMDAKDLRPMLQGVAMSHYVDENVNVFCATDAFRLATWGIVPEDFLEKDTYILAPQLIKLVSKLPIDKKEELEILMDQNAAISALRAGDVVLVVSFLTGTFPPFEKLLPSEEALSIKINLDKAELKETLQRIKPLISKESEGVIQLIFSEDKIILKTESNDNSEAREEITLTKKITPPEFTINIRLAHLMDALNSFAGEDALELCLQADEGKAVVLRSENQPEQLSLTMPKVV